MPRRNRGERRAHAQRRPVEDAQAGLSAARAVGQRVCAGRRSGGRCGGGAGRERERRHRVLVVSHDWVKTVLQCSVGVPSSHPSSSSSSPKVRATLPAAFLRPPAGAPAPPPPPSSRANLARFASRRASRSASAACQPAPSLRHGRSRGLPRDARRRLGACRVAPSLGWAEPETRSVPPPGPPLAGPCGARAGLPQQLPRAAARRPSVHAQLQQLRQRKQQQQQHQPRRQLQRQQPQQRRARRPTLRG